MNATLARLTRLVAEPSREPDARLLDAYLTGSQSAFRELVDRHARLVFGVCHRVLGHHQDAEDAFQATFLVLARRAADVWPRDAIGSWLYGVAYRVALKARAARARRLARLNPLEDIAQSSQPHPEPDTAEVVERAVRKLPELYRAAVVACDLEGLSRKQAAEQLGWKEGTLSGRLARARLLLAERLRKAGFGLPATGVAGLLGTGSAVRAGLTERAIQLATETAAGGVPAPLAALSEGVVQGMFAMKLKAAAAVVVVTFTVGLGAWAAGNGDGPGTGGTPAQPGSKAPGPQPLALQPPARATADLLALQGKWFVQSTDITGKPAPTSEGRDWPLFEIAGDNLSKPYREAGSEWKWEKYTITIDATQTPHTIDLIAPGKAVERGIYEFLAPAKTCGSCHTQGGPGFRPPIPNLIGLCGPGLKQVLTEPGLELRLAIGSDGKRPANFGGGQGVTEYRLTRVAAPDDDKAKLERERARILALLEAADTNLQDRAEAAARRAQLLAVQAALNEQVARLAVKEATARLQQAQAAADVAQVHYLLAKAELEKAEQQLTAAKKKVADAAKKPPAAGAKEAGKGDPAFTIHIRPQLAAEKVVSVNATGNKTVLEALAHAAKDMAIKPDALSAWVVRDKKVLPVDLAAILQKGDTTTNYPLQAGDQLFVQVKVGK